MPIIVKDYTWRQTNEIVVVQVPLKGVPYTKADVFTFENYIKQKKVKEKHDIFIDKILTKNNEPECVPLPREMGRINISFTPREFPTPSRESYRAEEEEWLKNQAEARRACGFVAADLKPEEQNPIWLKDKGDSFFQMGNYLGAISAYSHAIKIGSTLPAIYSNRAAAHLAIGNYYKAHEDSSRALDLLTPCVSLNAKSRARCFVRRATALCHLGAPENALKDLEKAQALAPETSLIEDIERVRIMIDKLSTGKEESIAAVCEFYPKDACHNKECPFLHIDPESKIKDCPWYDRGFCRHGPNCRHRHVRRVLCMNYLAGFCLDGPDCKFMHPRFELPATDVQQKDGKKLVITCHYCGETGHKALYCNKMPPEMKEAKNLMYVSKDGDDSLPKPPQKPLEEVTCFKCGCKGHYANKCPKGHLAFLSQSQNSSTGKKDD
ncbi:Cleavage and polyadenylation specificity factor subunit 4 [Gryllus bimaculatus]|nr:Cleavage and polyadenylation specificity factor subunit 4 [Gryllus bimaculatus]